MFSLMKLLLFKIDARKLYYNVHEISNFFVLFYLLCNVVLKISKDKQTLNFLNEIHNF